MSNQDNDQVNSHINVQLNVQCTERSHEKDRDQGLDSVETSELKAGTGFMINLADTIRRYETQGYSENLVACFDHFEARSGAIRLWPEEIAVDKVIRFENTSDPDDQSILYLISSNQQKVKGLYVDTFGPSSIELSKSMIERLKDHLSQRNS
jgi:hypothetical protein